MERYITDGRVVVSGDKAQRQERKRYDYLLCYAGTFPMAVVEAKDESHSPGDGMEQAKKYAQMLDVLFAYSTNGHGIEEFDFTTNKHRSLDTFPTPKELWDRWHAHLTAQKEAAVREGKKLHVVPAPTENPLLYPYYHEPEGKVPRYYQEIAIREVIQAVLGDQKRILLAMATGTGKTFVAFQVAWKLVKSGYLPRVLYLADRNFLRDQAHNNEFYPFGDARALIEEGKAPKTRDIYFSIYQALYAGEEGSRLYQQYEPDFFDLIIIDECHRSGFGTWHDILQYFSSAIHLGMTATPKRDDNIDTYAYFGKPIYSYSMGQGIDDGFLAPFLIHRILTNIDREGLHLSEAIYQGAQLFVPEEVDLREVYTLEDFEREINLPDRTHQICEHLAHILTTSGPLEKTMIFCVNIAHAGEVAKELQNRFSDLGYSDYAVRIVAEDGDIARAHYEQFRDSDRPAPVVATTVDLLTTGVDVPPARNIVLLKPIASKVVFKQIIGRGSRLDPNTNKYYFRIIDYVNATRLLDDWEFPPTGARPPFPEPPFDLTLSGAVIHRDTEEPVSNARVVAQIGPNLQRMARTDGQGRFILTELPHSPITLYVSATAFRSRQMTLTPPEDPSFFLVIEIRPEVPVAQKIVLKGIEVHIAEETQIIFTADGSTLTEAEYVGYSRDGVVERAASLQDLREVWIHPERRHSFLRDLIEHSIYPSLLASIFKIPRADTFDLLAHIAFDAPILSRDERAVAFRNLQGRFLSAFGREAQEVLLILLEKYRLAGVNEIQPQIFNVPPFDRMGYAPGVIRRFGGAEPLKKALLELRKRIYVPEVVA